MLVDMTQNYGSAFYSCAAGMAVSALFLGLVRPAKKGLLCRRRDLKHPEDKNERKGDSEEHSVVHKFDDITDDLMYDRAEAKREVNEVIHFA